MNEMNERVALALADKWHGRLEKWGAAAAAPYKRPPFESDGHLWRELAAAAIAAMREPEWAMAQAGHEIQDTRRNAQAEDIWRAMIDAALGHG